MKAVDTNVLARFFVDDPDDSQCQRQRAKAIEIMSGTIFVSTTVLLEFEWVMRGFYELPRSQVSAVLCALSSLDNVTIENRDAVFTALQWHQQGVDFADALHLALSHRCESLVTFDRGFARRVTGLDARPRVELA